MTMVVGIVQCTIFVNGVAISHAFIAYGTNGAQIFQSSSTPATFRNVVPHFKGKWGDDALTPFHSTLGIKIFPHPC